MLIKQNFVILKSLMLIVFLVLLSVFPIVSSIQISNHSNYEKLKVSLGSSWWNMFHRDEIKTGFSQFTGPENNDLLWSYPIDSYITASPAVAHGKIFIGSNDFKIYCFDMITGDKKWSYQTSGIISSSPAVVNEKVYIGSQDSNFYCLDANNGKVIWIYDTGFMIESSPTYKDGKVYFGSSDGNLYCLDAQDGRLIWSHSIDNIIWSAPAITDDRIYFGTLNGIFYCLDLEDGEFVWDYTVSSGIWGSPAVYDGLVYFGSNNNYIYCLDADTGDFVWSYDALGEVHSSPAIAYDCVYIGSSFQGLFCLDKDTGEFIWKFPENNGIWSPPSIADGKVYFGSDDCCGTTSSVYCVNAYTGGVIWSYNTGSLSGIKSSPAIVGGNVYIASGDGIVFAFGQGDKLIADAEGPYLNFISEPSQFKGNAFGGKPAYSYHWDFGDGTTSNEQKPIHTYLNPGKYNVILTVIDNDGNQASDETYALIQIPNINNPPDKPIIDGPANGKTGVEYTYCINATDPDNDYLYVYWDWGDNMTSGWLGPFQSGEKLCTNHTWFSQGSFTIKVQLKDEHDETVESSKVITMPKERYFNNLLNKIFSYYFLYFFKILIF